MIDDLETYWSGALEKQGIAPGLSTYRGRSSLFHSAPWGLEVGDVEYLRNRLTARGAPTHDPRWGKKPGAKLGVRHVRRYHQHTPEGDAVIVAKLKAGGTLAAIAKSLNCAVSAVRRVGRRQGVGRRAA